MSKRFKENNDHGGKVVASKTSLSRIGNARLENIKVVIRRPQLPEPSTPTPIQTSLDDPSSLTIHREGEGAHPIFARKGIVVNVEEHLEERIVCTSEDQDDVDSRCSRSRSRSDREHSQDSYKRRYSRSQSKESNRGTKSIPKRSKLKSDSCKDEYFDKKQSDASRKKMNDYPRRDSHQNDYDRRSRDASPQPSTSKKDCSPAKETYRTYKQDYRRSPRHYDRNRSSSNSPKRFLHNRSGGNEKDEYSRNPKNSCKQSDELYSDDNVNFVPNKERTDDDDDGGDPGTLIPPQPGVPTPTQLTIEVAAPTTNVPNWPHNPSDMTKRHSQSPSSRRRSRTPHLRKKSTSPYPKHHSHSPNHKRSPRRESSKPVRRSKSPYEKRRYSSSGSGYRPPYYKRRSPSPYHRRRSRSPYRPRKRSHTPHRDSFRQKLSSNTDHRSVEAAHYEGVHPEFGYYGAMGYWTPGPIPRPGFIPRGMIPPPRGIFPPPPYMHRPYMPVPPHPLYRPWMGPDYRSGKTKMVPTSSKSTVVEASASTPVTESSSTVTIKEVTSAIEKSTENVSTTK
ncbi:hypothetical protein FQA39_LY14585 [Lamprigera yunnana]|nr:hypothetical protein FQA39_LY14585 [Lamprigera yunnana]